MTASLLLCWYSMGWALTGVAYAALEADDELELFTPPNVIVACFILAPAWLVLAPIAVIHGHIDKSKAKPLEEAMSDNVTSEASAALWMIQGESPEARAAFTANWLRGTIVIPDEVMLRIWLIENKKRGLTPIMEG